MKNRWLEINNNGYEPTVILVSSETMNKLRKEGIERFTYLSSIPYTIEMLGNQVPLIIQNNLPDNVEFIAMSKKDYERLKQKGILAE